MAELPLQSITIGSNKYILSGSGSVDSTSEPTADTVAEFDSNAHMNSTDMDASEISDFIDGLNVGAANYDSGWQTATLSSQFALYNSSDADRVKYRRVGKVVQINGTVKPASNIAGSDTQYQIFTLPEGFRPSSTVVRICQGTGNAVWLMAISPTGVVYFSRYRYMDASGSGGYSQATTGVWLPFSETFLVD